ncbi:uncharacterized protein Bfra_006266 [Botrytis fragariae]|uniref:DUF7587 domain-containing protein n=1 Tax=Botrytis fragariae TaxID=1964551 RepID=A0A8H6ENU6_9HELO|nr:uncharacterized protein Bfra_006266 [Botrytis fragariae]KAF5879062.1 hypothetical protein Bfra_006266 [Botrytis fragariae]
MPARSEFSFAASLSTSLPGDNNNDGTAISPPKDLGTDGSVPSTGDQPSTPRFNSKNPFISTPDHTPPSPPLSLNEPTTSSTDPTSERMLSSFGKLSLSDSFIPTSPSITYLSKLDTSPDTPIIPFGHTLQNKENNTDTLLYRLQNATSKTNHSRSYGFRCSGWMDSLYTSGVTDERQADGRAFQSHCNFTFQPSPYISVSTSVARIMRLPQFKKEDEAKSRVFVISLNRLRQLGIKAQSTDKYLEKFVNSAGNQIYSKQWHGDDEYKCGVRYVTDTHWLVEKWIPDQAIVSEMDFGEFLKIAEREGITREVAKINSFITELDAQKIDLEKWPKRDGSEQEKVIMKPESSSRIFSALL